MRIILHLPDDSTPQDIFDTLNPISSPDNIQVELFDIDPDDAADTIPLFSSHETLQMKEVVTM